MKKKFILLGTILLGIISSCKEVREIDNSKYSLDTIFLQKGEVFNDIIINSSTWTDSYVISKDTIDNLYKVYGIDPLNRVNIKYIIKEEK